MNTPDTDTDLQKFEELFFGKHGVSDVDVEPDLADYKRFIDTSDPDFLTPQEKNFVRAIVFQGKSQTEAYLQAFDPDGTFDKQYAKSAASRLMKRPRVAKFRWQALQERDAMADEHLPSLIRELNEDRELARQLGQPSAAIAAVKTKANLLGLENNAPSTVTVNIGLSDDQRNAILSRIMKKNETMLQSDMIEKPIQPVLGGEPIDAEFEEVKPENE